MPLKIWGESDDLVELEGVTGLVRKCPECGHRIETPTRGVVGEGSDEIGCYDAEVEIVVGRPPQTAVATVRFGDRGWEYTLDAARAPWPCSLLGDDGIVIDAPDGTPIEWEMRRS